ncbi:hypothetical protein AVEN_141486-1 [Araneus ventricosus]|uniref:Uncharacterized protein n=1 Tax=Araneus ventricosus TaxID=182803 RepID=A0A4Y2WDV9_ARAVE|nr:hypothetical protein AVEN_141486-1 [Araneus ventricosus]
MHDQLTQSIFSFQNLAARVVKLRGLGSEMLWVRIRGCPLTPQIAILVCSRLALQICKLTANLRRQECKCETSLQQVNASFEVTVGRICNKFAA